MNIYIYSDESGVFDKEHNDAYIFGGVITLGINEKEVWSRKYSNAERTIRCKKNVSKDFELKAANLKNSEKGKLFRSLNRCYKFCVIIKQQDVMDNIFENKKSKQRYLDYAYKIGIKRALQDLIRRNIIIADDIERILFYIDEHTTATNGRYELKEALEQELKIGTYNYNYMMYYPPIFPNLKSVELGFYNSQKKLLVRAADIIANRVYYLFTTNQISKLDDIPNIHIVYQPLERS